MGANVWGVFVGFLISGAVVLQRASVKAGSRKQTGWRVRQVMPCVSCWLFVVATLAAAF
jgi:hypothetical protein